jgi:hypothetical protein
LRARHESVSNRLAGRLRQIGIEEIEYAIQRRSFTTAKRGVERQAVELASHRGAQANTDARTCGERMQTRVVQGLIDRVHRQAEGSIAMVLSAGVGQIRMNQKCRLLHTGFKRKISCEMARPIAETAQG